MSEVNPYSTHGAKPPSLGGEQRHRFELHSPYGPDGEPWLERSYAATVLREVRAGYEEMRAQDPDLYVGMTVYGSSVKGRFHEASDVDICLYVDPDGVSRRSLSLDRAAHKKKTDLKGYIGDGLEAVGLRHQVGDCIMHLMNSRLAADYTSRALVGLREAQKKNEQRSGIQGVHVVSATDFIASDIRSLFFLQLGSGRIRDYRRQVLDVLQKSGEEGSLIWKALASWVVDLEEGRRGASIYFPDALEKAYSYFGLKEPEFTMFELGGDGVQKLSGGGAVRLLGSARKARQKALTDV